MSFGWSNALTSYSFILSTQRCRSASSLTMSEEGSANLYVTESNNQTSLCVASTSCMICRRAGTRQPTCGASRLNRSGSSSRCARQKESEPRQNPPGSSWQ
jgi:hypothetical protein